MSSKTYKVIFLGTPDFAVPGLAALAADPRFTIEAVITQEDKPVGRHGAPQPTAVKKEALAHGFNVWQPRRIKEIGTQLKTAAPDFLVVIAYGQLLPPEILAIPKIASINVHASLLPRYRGAACLQAPILNGDKETGVTVMLMDRGLDTGDILRQEKIILDGTETLATLHDKLAQKGAAILGDTLADYATGSIKPQKQNEAAATYIHTIKKEDGRIDWSRPAETIERQIRAYNPWPGTFASLGGKTLKIIRATVTETIPETAPGQIIIQNKQLFVACGQNALLILELQLEGKKATNAASFIAGHPDFNGQKLV
jgi:methionyl-tRNA formyltransferase